MTFKGTAVLTAFMLLDAVSTIREGVGEGLNAEWRGRYIKSVIRHVPMSRFHDGTSETVIKQSRICS